MDIVRKIRYLGVYRGTYKLVYNDGYYWTWLFHYGSLVEELKIDEVRAIVNLWQTDERFQFKPEDLPEVE